ncbi:hypothetical protein KL918_003622 [Ogataea parapolymorpha]|uniref:CTLH domain-containing protein n=1 Tax=Ogataea parapolymorpha (strain ATCC 26012 / BCRC 20466 / JCM 22074 / NRRL Y-7560 / DL-1) TaxID=871575 RepID=W1QID8_OGAPD|nr:hypothetical protein HPODL_04839 [Ogataea parapolymorpha DL-1]ESX02079.1 hypothetical protein HPODL_04839 [Ogataea parapolymorpha DL-1]KAG7866157.1 hypothetical protein KL918_003622 [Ogataea parapolymorpha]KAG7871290.1 hypothetical protein KL916_004085 [Ogataea parapolymorpha]
MSRHETYLKLIKKDLPVFNVCHGDDIKDRIATQQELELMSKVDHLVLNYLIYEGYINAARDLAKELGFDFISDALEKDVLLQPIETSELGPDDDFDVEAFFSANEIQKNIYDSYKQLIGHYDEDPGHDLAFYKRLSFGLSSIKSRNEIKLHILNGQIEEAVVLINKNFPSLFEKNQFIYFKLLHLNLIEIIRTQFAGPPEKCLDEKQFLDRVLHFISSKLSTLKILQNKDFVQELELTMALLCFGKRLRQPDMEGVPVKLKSLLNLKVRGKVADLVNKSILLNVNNCDLDALSQENQWYLTKISDKKNGVEPGAAEALDSRFEQVENSKLRQLMSVASWLCEVNDEDFASLIKEMLDK